MRGASSSSKETQRTVSRKGRMDDEGTQHMSSMAFSHLSSSHQSTPCARCQGLTGKLLTFQQRKLCVTPNSNEVCLPLHLYSLFKHIYWLPIAHGMIHGISAQRSTTLVSVLFYSPGILVFLLVSYRYFGV